MKNYRTAKPFPGIELNADTPGTWKLVEDAEVWTTLKQRHVFQVIQPKYCCPFNKNFGNMDFHLVMKFVMLCGEP